MTDIFDPITNAATKDANGNVVGLAPYENTDAAIVAAIGSTIASNQLTFATDTNVLRIGGTVISPFEFGGYPITFDGNGHPIPPNPLSSSFLKWAPSLVAYRRAQIAAPSTTYYFSQAGFDAQGTGANQGDGSLAHPWKTIGKANSTLATAGNRCLLRRGDEWASAVGLVVGEGASVGSYGDSAAGHTMAAAKPLVHCFTHAIASGATWGTPSGNRYPYTVNNMVPVSVTLNAGTGPYALYASGTSYPFTLPLTLPQAAGIVYNGQPVYGPLTMGGGWEGYLVYNTIHGSGFTNNTWVLTNCQVAGSTLTAYYSTGLQSGTSGVAGINGTYTPAWGPQCQGTFTITPNLATQTPPVGWIRNVARRLDAYAWMGTAAAITAGGGQAAASTTAQGLVASTPYSWFFDPITGLLHLNANGTNPNTITWEFSDTTIIAQEGVSLTGNGYVFGLRSDGWGCGPANGSAYNGYWSFAAQGATGTSAVIEDCEGYYSSRHIFGSTTGSAGGAVAFINCMGGYTSNCDASGTSTYVGYSTGGGNEALVWNSTCRFGDLPWSGGPLSGWTACSAFVTHCGTGNLIGMALTWGLRTTAEAGWANATWGSGYLGFTDAYLPGTTGDYASMRAWAVGSSYAVPSAPVCGNGNPATKAILINAFQRITLTAYNAVGAQKGVHLNSGLSINEQVDIVDPDGGPTGTRILIPLGTMVNASVRITCATPATIVQIDNDYGETGKAPGYLTNCVFSAVGAAATSAVLIPTANCSHNAYSGFADARSGTEAGKITLNSAVDPEANPDPGSVLWRTGVSPATQLGTNLAYDAAILARRPLTPTIGAKE